jgi:ubiquinone/menaquinone biosynthesis C-methylase UbiE
MKIFDSIFDATSMMSHKHQSVLDVGCGVGDFWKQIDQKNLPIDYLGVDISKEVIQEAMLKNPSLPKRANFACGDFLDIEFQGKFDWVIAAGSFNLSLQSSDNFQYQYVDFIFEKMFKLCKKGVVVTMLSDLGSFPNGLFKDLFYYSPSKILSHSLKLTNSVILDHDSLDSQFICSLLKAQ